MAELVVAAAGYAASAAVGGGFTGAIAGAVASAVVASLLAPTQKTVGPQLSDLKVTSASAGTPIPWIRGHPRVAGHAAWNSDKIKITTVTRSGKGGGKSKNTTFTYKINILYLVSDNPIAGVLRIWIDGKLVWTMDAAADGASLQASIETPEWESLTVYTGEPTQLPDPDYEADVGVGNACAYRDRGTVAIKGLQLGAGQMRNVEFEVVSAGTFSISSWLSDSSGNNPDIDVGTGTTHTYDPVNFYAGNGSMQCRNGQRSRIIAPPIPLWSYGTQDFKLQLWCRPTGWDYGTLFIQTWDGSNEDIRVRSLPDGSVHFRALSGAVDFNSFALGGLLTIGAWNKVEFERIATGFSGRVNGVLCGSGSNAGAVQTMTAAGEIQIGNTTGVEAFPGNIDSMTFTVGTTIIADWRFDAYDRLAVTSLTLASVVSDVCLRGGWLASEFDVTALTTITTPVHALWVSQITSPRQTLEQLMGAYSFTCRLSDKIYFIPLDGAPSGSIAYEDLGWAPEGSTVPDPLGLILENAMEIPSLAALNYSNLDGDFQPDTQGDDRQGTALVDIGDQRATTVFEVPMAFTASEAKQIVVRYNLRRFVSAYKASIAVSMDQAKYEPGDTVLTTAADGSVYLLRLLRKIDAQGVLTFETCLEDVTTLVQAGITTGGTTPQNVVSGIVLTTMVLMDIPMLRDVDNQPGFYIAIKGADATWPGAGLYESLDGVTYNLIQLFAAQATIGTCGTTLQDWTGGNVIDTVSTLSVSVGAGELYSYTEANFQAGTAPAYLVGNEIIYALTATLLGPGTYALTNLVRGRRGTEWAQTGHAINERFVQLSETTGGLYFRALQISDLGVQRYYKAVTEGQELSAVNAQTITPLAVNLEPFSPVHATADRTTADTVLGWTPRTRLSTRVGGTVPQSIVLSESPELYEVDIFASAADAIAGTPVLRTLSSTSTTVTYTAAQQATDSTSASVQYIRVYMISGAVGRGYPLVATV